MPWKTHSIILWAIPYRLFKEYFHLDFNMNCFQYELLAKAKYTGQKLFVITQKRGHGWNSGTDESHKYEDRYIHIIFEQRQVDMMLWD